MSMRKDKKIPWFIKRTYPAHKKKYTKKDKKKK